MPELRQARRRDIQRFLRANYTYAFLYDFILGYAIYTAYMSLQGLSATTIGLLLAVWSASAIIFELPSGALSDRFDRRVLLVLSPLIKATCFILWALADDSVWMYAGGFVAWSLAESLKSGTKDAVFYEHIHRVGLGRTYDKRMGRDKAFYEAGAWTGLFLGGFVAAYDMELSLWLSVAPLVMASIAGFWLTDVRNQARPLEAPETESPDPIPYRQHFTNAAREFRTRPRLRALALYLCFGVTVLWVMEEFVQLVYLAVELPIWAFGAVGVALGVMRVFLTLNAYRLRAVPHVFALAPVGAGVLLALVGLSDTLIVLVPLILAAAVFAPAEVLAEADFQKAMEGQSRATTTSGLNVGIELVAVVMLAVMGWLIERVGVLSAYQIGGAYLLLFAVWFWCRGRQGLVPTD